MISSRIVKNTLVLYIRMILFTIISLYTARVVLNVLGVEDYGIYNVVTGFVLAFGFLNNAMSASVQRFLTVEFKKNSLERLNKIFSLSISIHLILAILMVLIAESVGLYFLKNKMVIPEDRAFAASCIFHFSVVSLFFSILNVPYKALIITHEHMSAFALISLFEVFAKLVVALILPIQPYDKLITYAALLTLISVILQFIYMFFCKKRYDEASYHTTWDSRLFKDMSIFAGWNLIGVLAGVAQNQGVNIVLNIFGGPVVNAARGISYQVGSAVNQLVTNFQVAVTPPIMKAYSNEDSNTRNLVLSSSKLSFILLLFVIVPIYIFCPQLLNLWLKNVPEYAVQFTRLVLLDTLFASFAGPIHMLFQATGRIRNYQIIISGILLMNLPLAYLLLHYGYTYESVFLLTIILTLVTLVLRLIMIRKYINIDFIIFTVHVFLPCFAVAILSFVFTYLLSMISSGTIVKLILNMLMSVLIVALATWVVGLSKDEKKVVYNYVRKNHEDH